MFLSIATRPSAPPASAAMSAAVAPARIFLSSPFTRIPIISSRFSKFTPFPFRRPVFSRSAALDLTPARPAAIIILLANSMNPNYLDSFGPLLLQMLAAMGLSAVLVLLSMLVGQHKRTRAKGLPYECGIPPTGDAREPFSVQFYLVAILFILFDIEAIFLYPWALVYRAFLAFHLGLFAFSEMLLYIFILLAGYLYLWKKGALNWNR